MGVCGWAGTAAGSPEHGGAKAQLAAGRDLLVSQAQRARLHIRA